MSEDETMATLISNGTDMLLVDGREVRGTFTVEQEWIDATPMAENDPNWVHVDSHGHTHRWMAGPDPLVPLRDPHHQTAVLPSLRYVLDSEPHWCELCLGDYQPGHYECVICGDEVSPGTRRTVVANAAGRHEGPEAASLDLEALVDAGELTIRDVAWLVEQASQAERDIADGPINWHFKAHSKNCLVFTMRSSVKPTTWLAMYVDREGWEAIKAAGDVEMRKAAAIEDGETP